ncbi:MAG: hypothetical protein AAF614_10750 [Chloroflexota bacterium]
MKRILLLIGLLFLVACGGETVAEPTAEPAEEAVAAVEVEEAAVEETEAEEMAEEEPTAVPEPEPTAAPEEEPEEMEEESASEEEEAPSADLSPEELLADASLVRTEDWAKGSSDPLITIIEYGDFQ